MSKQPYYDGKHTVPRTEVTSEQVAALRARAAELGLSVPATSKRSSRKESTVQVTEAPTRDYPAVFSASVTTPHALAISELDLSAIRPSAWWRAMWRSTWRSLMAPFR